MKTYYHITTSAYQDGDDLISAQEQIERYGETINASKWDDELYDTDIVCLFATRDEAEEAMGLPEFRGCDVLLAVSIDDEDEQPRINDEGYPYVRRVYGRQITRL